MGDNGRRDMFVECEQCHARLWFKVVTILSFLDDAHLIVDLLHGRLNAFSCPACTWPVRLRPEMVIFHPGGAEIFFFCEPDDELRELWRESLQTEGFVLHDTDDYTELCQAINQRASEFLAMAIEAFEAGELGLLRYPLAMLLLRELSESEPDGGYLISPPVSPEPDQARFAGLLEVAVDDAIDKMFADSFDDGGPQTVLDTITQQIPAECLTVSVLHGLTARCVNLDPEVRDDAAALDRACGFEYLNAAAHSAAGVANPRGLHWAKLHLTAFRVSWLSLATVPDALLLDTAVLRRTIRFTDAWTVAIDEIERSDPRPDYLDDWFALLGMFEQYVNELRLLPAQMGIIGLLHHDDTEAANDVVATFARTQASAGGRGTLSVAEFVDTTCASLVYAGRPGVAKLLVDEILQRLLEQGDLLEAGQTLRVAVEVFNGSHAFGISDELMYGHLDRILASGVLPCRLRYSLLNEMANVYRYTFRHYDALAKYDEVADVMAECDDVDEHDLRALERNRAIVLRGIGRFDEALRRLEQLMDGVLPESLEAVGLRTSLAITLLELGLPKLAVAQLRAALSVAPTFGQSQQRVTLLIALAVARVDTEIDPDLGELDEALAIAGTVEHLRRAVARSVLMLASRANICANTTLAAEAIATEAIEATAADSDVLFASDLTPLARWYWVQGRTADAIALMNKLDGLPAERWPWETQWLLAQMAEPADVEGRARLALRALNPLGRKVPADTEPSYAAFWLAGKESFQDFLKFAVQQAVSADRMPAGAAVEVCEFVNGREVRPRRMTAATASAQEELARVVPHERLAVAVACLETEDAIDLILVHSSAREGPVIRLPMPVAELRSIQATFDECLQGALLASQRRAADAVLSELLAHVGDLLDAHLEDGVHVCLLPSASLLGLPLHAATVGNRLLMERHTISYGPNLAMVCATLAGGPVCPPDSVAAGLVVVPKEGDFSDLVSYTDAAADVVHDMLTRSSPATADLRGTCADKSSCLDLFAELDHLVLLLHGAEASASSGRGFCVSDGVDLPRAPLAADRDTQLRRFLIDAGDLAMLPKTPATVVSLACSSGLTVPGAGGSRIGLERALLPNGTRTLIAPMWDVDQRRSVDLIVDFHRRWVEDPAAGPAEHLRQAQLAARERADSLYYWAPFVLKGNWI